MIYSNKLRYFHLLIILVSIVLLGAIGTSRLLYPHQKLAGFLITLAKIISQNVNVEAQFFLQAVLIGLQNLVGCPINFRSTHITYAQKIGQKFLSIYRQI